MYLDSINNKYCKIIIWLCIVLARLLTINIFQSRASQKGIKF